LKRFIEKAAARISQLEPQVIQDILDNQQKELGMLDSLLDLVERGLVILSRDLSVIYTNRIVNSLMPVRPRYQVPSSKASKFIADADVLTYLKDFASQDTYTNSEKEFTFDTLGSLKTVVIRLILTDKLLESKSVILMCLTDVTQARKDSAKLRRNESLAAMTTMAAGVAHEIKNPLASISIYLQLLAQDLDEKGSIDPDTARKYIGIMSSQLDRLDSIVVDFLFAVRPMDSKLKLQDINPLLISLEEFVHPDLEQKGIELVLQLDKRAPKLLLDQNLLNQALLNLIYNAQQTLEEKQAAIPGFKGQITLSSKFSGNHVEIIVSDNGMGISKANQTKIFEPYYTTKAKGTGLGLTVFFKVIKEHNGEVGLISEEGEGTSFTVTLPVPQSERMRLEANNG
jgi:two-component system, sporulation sensor kinase E